MSQPDQTDQADQTEPEPERVLGTGAKPAVDGDPSKPALVEGAASNATIPGVTASQPDATGSEQPLVPATAATATPASTNPSTYAGGTTNQEGDG